MFPQTLAHLVWSRPTAASVRLDFEEIENEFYEVLANDVRLSGVASISRYDEHEIRKMIGFELTGKGGNSALVVLSAVGNPLLDDRERLKELYKIAVGSVGKGFRGNTRVKMLAVPKL